MPVHGPGEEDEVFSIKSSMGDQIYLQMPMQLVQITGLAMPPMDWRTVRAPFQHGVTYLGFSLRPRPVQVALHVRGHHRLNLWEKRRQLIDLLNPLVGTLRLRVSYRDGSIFELHQVVYDTGFESGTDGQSEPSTQAIGIRFMAEDPVWYRYPERSESPALTVVSDLVFGDVEPPSTMIFGITFGSVHIDEALNVTVRGNWMAFPTMELTGPMYYPLIENLTTGEKLQLNYVIQNGEVVTITTRFGYKTVISSTEGDIIGLLSLDSDLATFHLDPNPIAADGVNVMNFWAGNCTAASGITVRWYDRYLGL